MSSEIILRPIAFVRNQSWARREPRLFLSWLLVIGCWLLVIGCSYNEAQADSPVIRSHKEPSAGERGRGWEKGKRGGGWG